MTLALATAFLAVSQTLSLPPGLLSAVCYVESKHNAKAINHQDGGSDSLGACQVKLTTARAMGYKGVAKGLMVSEVNAYWAAKYLQYQIHRYNGDILAAVSAYNVGQYRTLPDGKPVNLDYVRKVLMAWANHQ